MTYEDFEKSFEVRVEMSRQVLLKKNVEYARGGDKLSNFKKAAAMQSVHPVQALQGMMAKHQVSVADMIADLNKGVSHPRAMWDEKIGDALNYLFLLNSLLEDTEYAKQSE